MVWFIVGGILDLLITIQYVKAGGSYLAGLKMFYSAKSLWAGFLLMFVGAVLAAKMTRGGELMKPNTPMPPQQPPMMPKV